MWVISRGIRLRFSHFDQSVEHLKNLKGFRTLAPCCRFCWGCMIIVMDISSLYSSVVFLLLYLTVYA